MNDASERLLMSWLAETQFSKVLCLFNASIFLLIAAGGR